MKLSACILFLWLCLFPLENLKGQALVFQSAFEETAFSKTDSLSTENALALLLATDAGMDRTKMQRYLERFHNFCLILQEKKTKKISDKRFLQFVFEQVRKEFFRNYSPYPSFQRLFSDGTYNCLSASALYALVLQKFNYRVHIHETAFHAYLIVETRHRQFLMDGTDPEGGFLVYIEQIKQREAFYREAEKARYQPNLNRIITLRELCGLQYYNKATLQFNKQNYSRSMELLEKAAFLYRRSERIKVLQASALQNQQQYIGISAQDKSRKKAQISSD